MDVEIEVRLSKKSSSDKELSLDIEGETIDNFRDQETCT